MAKTPGTGIKIGTHFSPRFKRPIDDRFQFDTIAEMAGFAETALYDGIETFVSQNKKTYKYLSTNPIDPTTGRWRLVGSESYTKEESDAKFIPVDQKNVADGVAGLDASGKIIKSQLNLNKKDVGLDNVDNTADLDKPISKDTQDALDLKANIADVEADLSTKANKDEVYDKTETDTLLDTKVDKIDGKSLSTNDLTDELKAEYDDAVLLKHSHDNKDLLDTLTDDLIQKWNGKQDLIQYKELPLASAELNGKVYQYIGIETENRKVGNFYKCVEKTTDVYDWVELQAEVESIQKESLPEPTIDLVNKIYQYVGPNILGSYQKGYFYICQEDTENLGTYVWKQKNVQPSTEGGSSTLERDITANVNVGGVTSGKTFLEGTSITDVLESILVKPVYQTVKLTLSEDLIQKIGTTISSVNMTATIVKGNNPITNVKYYVGASLVDTKDSTTDPAIVNGGTYTYEYTTPFSTDTTFKVDVLAGDHTETATRKIQFINPYYTGSSTTSTISDFTGLTEEIVVKNTKKEVTYGVTDNEYLVFAYDKRYGSLTSIKDENNFENIGSWNKSELTVGGQNYFVYITQLPVTIETTFKYIFTI